MQTIAILGSTGSIGTQALELVRLHPEEFRVVALTARSSREKLFEQVREFRPEVAGLTEPIPMSEIPEDVRFCRWVMGEEALRAAAAEVPADMVLVSVVGIAGLQSVMDALGANRQVLLANKEALVTGGHLVMDAAKRIGKPILPVDSEHSAIFQCLQGAGGNQPVRLLLTASGGPFRTWTREQMQNATRAQALKHPNWSMGAKITIDSASMFNKALEIIEAHWLFDMPPAKIQVVVHPQSIVHSAVEFADGAVLAQLGVPDMRIPIQYAKRQVGRKMYGGQSTHLPLRVNTAGVIPPIFASSLLLFPATMANFDIADWLKTAASWFTPSSILYNVIFIALIFFFCFFYTAIIFDPKDVAENLKKAGGFIPGIRPGEKTQEYLDAVLSRLTLWGGVYISVISVLPMLLIAEFNVPFYFGGTSILILVGVAMDFMSQIESHLISRQYEGLMGKTRMKGRS